LISGVIFCRGILHDVSANSILYQKDLNQLLEAQASAYAGLGRARQANADIELNNCSCDWHIVSERMVLP
jgi:hypothetical protein